MEIEEVKRYFYAETRDMEVSKIELVEIKTSYFDTIECFKVDTTQNVVFYVFSGDTTLTNIYPAHPNETLNECYYKHVGFMAEYVSKAIGRNFLLNFLDDFSIFPILHRRMQEISSDITLDLNSDQLSGLANQIRSCYITLTDYLMNKLRTKNSEFKNDNFKDNLSEFLALVLPGHKSESRRNVINAIAQKGWKLNSELVHKDTVTVFDVMISFNILQLIVSMLSNVIVGNNMPFNKVKCPRCNSEKHMMQQDSATERFKYICEDCGCAFEVSMDQIIKKF